MSLTDYIAPDRQLGQNATEREIDRRFAADLEQLAAHEDISAEQYTDALGRVHCITLMKRTAPVRVAYTARVRWAWGGEKRNDVHLLTADGAIKWARKAIEDQAETDARATFDQLNEGDRFE